MATPIISREDAKSSGLKRFFTGDLCGHGHVAERYVSSGNCVQCAAIRFDAWYASTRREKHDAAHKNSELRKRAKAAGELTYFAVMTCKNGHAERSVSDNRCAICKRSRGKRWWKKTARTRYAEKSAEILQANRRWRRKNRDIIRQNKRVSEQRRRKQVRGSGEGYTRHQIADLLKRQKGKCAFCCTPIRRKYEIDHIHPLALGGSNKIGNIQLLCPDCNRRKGAKHPLAWAAVNGLLV